MKENYIKEGLNAVALLFFMVGVITILAVTEIVQLPVSGVVAFTVGVVSVMTGVGLYYKHNLAWYPAVILAFLWLFEFPIGTLIGIIVLIFLFTKEIRKEFEVTIV